VPTDDKAMPLNAMRPNSFRLVMGDVPDGPCSNLVMGNNLVTWWPLGAD
jgi:hypothetical protein